MRTLGLLLTLLTVSPQAISEQKLAVPEGTIITSAQVTGFDIERLSPGLQREIRGLPGTPLSEQHLRELAARIEAERPNHVAAVRTVMDAGGEARVFFVVGRQDEPARDDNINARYIVEQANITGVCDAELTPDLRDALAAVIGKRLDSPEADRLRERIERNFEGYEVSRRIRRGSEAGRIRLVYELHKRELPAWLDFEALRSNVLFHSDHGWGSYLDLALGGGDVRVTPILAFDNADDLVEEYSGYGLRVESRRLGTRRLGASFEWTRFKPDWEDATLNALASAPAIPPLYERRTTVSPLVKLALTPDLSVAAGVSISELEARSPATGSQSANAFVTSIEFDRRWDGDAGQRHRVGAAFGVRAASTELESDLSYERYLGQGTYRFRFGRHRLQATGMAGRINGDAPLFERFTLGDSRTLRGWNKYDIAPLGGDRLFYSSLEYRYRGLALFLDAGSVWDRDTERRVRVSSGFGFHAGPAFLTIGFPLNTDDVTAAVALGLRVQGIGIRW
ncbi:MAG TPA: BamA/TamA family outer membrane protein [Vicinamibacterales bacterium]